MLQSAARANIVLAHASVERVGRGGDPGVRVQAMEVSIDGYRDASGAKFACRSQPDLLLGMLRDMPSDTDVSAPTGRASASDVR